MNLKERIDVLVQAAEIAQKNGILSLYDASIAQHAIESLQAETQMKSALEILIKICILGQKNGVYSLQDAHFIYLAMEDIESVIPDEPQQTEQDNPVEDEAK